jgi:VWFA-related protein
VTRLEIEPDEIPAGFPLERSSVLLEYGFTDVAGHSYLLPSYAETRVATAQFEFRNEIEFRNYRKFDAESSIRFGEGNTAAGRAGVGSLSNEPKPGEAASPPVTLAASARPTETAGEIARLPDAPVFPRPPEPSAGQRRENRLATFEVVVLDGHGRPVPGLTAGDFHLQDQGRYMRIAVCRASDTAAEPEPPALAAGQYSNRSPAGAPLGVRVILFDTLNPIDPRFARNQLARALRQYASDEHVYLYFLTPQGLEAVRGIPHLSGMTGPLIRLGDVDIGQAFDRALKANVDSYGVDPNDLAYRSLRSLASRLASFPGRKSIIWISRGVEISNASLRPEYSHDYSRLFAETSLALQRAKVAIYPVGDARLEIGSESMGVLNEISAVTGGRANLNVDVASALKQATADSRLTYTIGFFPDTWDDKLHKMRITSPVGGVHLLAPASYLAEAQRATPAERERAAIQNAALSPLESGEIGLQATMEPDAAQPELRHFRIRMNAHDLRVYQDDQDNRYEGSLSITVLAYDGAGRLSSSETTPYLFHLTPADRDAALKGGLNVSVQHAVHASTEKIRVIVFDRYSDAAGSVTIPLAR